MTVDQSINLLVTIALIEMMLAVGLRILPADLVSVAGNWRLVARAALANYAAVPVATCVLLVLLDIPLMVAIGFLILAACPGAPFGPPCTALAGGDVPTSTGLMVLLAASSALVAPLLLSVLLPYFAGSAELTVDNLRIVRTLLFVQLLPLCLGVAIRRWYPTAAEKLQQPANQFSILLNLSALSFVLATQYSLLSEVRIRGYFGMLALLVASLSSGWIFGGPGRARRRAVSLTTALRNVGVCLVIAADSFPGTAVLSAILVYGLFEIIGALLLALWWGCGGAPPHGENFSSVEHSISSAAPTSESV